MEIWKSIQYVTTGFTLIAFAIAAAAWLYKWRSEIKLRLIKSAPASERAALIQQTLEFLQIETAGLSQNQQFQIAIAQINARSARFKTTAIVVCIIAVIFSLITGYAISKAASSRPIEPMPNTSSVMESPKLTLSRWWLGGWDVVISNPNQSELALTDAMLVVKRYDGPDLGFPLIFPRINLPKTSPTLLNLVLFDESAIGAGNLKALQGKPAIDFFSRPDTTCFVEVKTTNARGEINKPHEEFNCSRVAFPRLLKPKEN